MAGRGTVERWVAEAGVSAESVHYVAGEPVIWRACGRCGGTGYVWATHVDGGRCFACGTAKGRYVSLSSLASAVRVKARKTERAVTEARASSRRAARKAREFLAAHEGLAAALRTRGVEIIRSFARKLAWKGEISPRMIEVAFKVAREEAEKAAEVTVAAPTGREAVEATVLTVREVESIYGISTKMLVKVTTEVGSWKAWGSVPSGLHPLEKGATVRFTAAFEPKAGEESFAYFKRPTKASVVAEAPGSEEAVA